MTRILGGIRVLEAANFVSGPYVGQLLADLGAQVTKIENPRGGDPFRGPSGYNPEFLSYNPHKQSVALDISKPAGAAIFKRLAAAADVVVENFRPGVIGQARPRLDRTRRDQSALGLLRRHRVWAGRALLPSPGV